ncbi:MAG: hypothetical protein AAFX40_17455, partial [Cyanobacteria bacterium J06639_1]
MRSWFRLISAGKRSSFLLSLACFLVLASCGGDSSSPTSVVLPSGSPPTNSGGDRSTPTPNPSASPGAQPVPSNGIVVQILNADEMDGRAMTIGESMSLQAQATAADGTDITDQIVWTNAKGDALGNGGELTYDDGSETKMETVMARVETPAGDAFDRVSFSFNPSDVDIAPNVKVLGPEAEDNIIELDLASDRLVLQKDFDLPNIEVGDVLIGANTQLPPVEVFELTDTGSTLEMQVGITEPGDIVISGGTSAVDQPVDLSEFVTDTPQLITDAASLRFAGGVSDAVSLRAQPPAAADLVFTLYDIPLSQKEFSTFKDRAKWGPFKSSGLKLQLQLFAQEYIGFDFKPNVDVDLNFSGGQIDRFELLAEGAQSAVGGITIDGLTQLSIAYEADIAKTPKGQAPKITLGSIGVIPVWIAFPSKIKFGIEPSVKLSAQDVIIGFEQSADVSLDVRYDGSSWSGTPTASGT